MRAGGSVALVASEDSHFFLWAACVEYLTEVLIRVPARERDLTTYILGATWRLLPEYRLRQIRVCLIRLTASYIHPLLREPAPSKEEVASL